MIPAFAGELPLGLEGQLDATLGVAHVDPDEAPTLDLESRASELGVATGAMAEAAEESGDTYDDEDLVRARPAHLEGEIGVQLTRPAEESGPWNGRGRPRLFYEAHVQDDGAAQDDIPTRQTSPALSQPSLPLAPRQGYELLAVVILAAAAGGFIFGLVNRDEVSKATVADHVLPSTQPSPDTERTAIPNISEAALEQDAAAEVLRLVERAERLYKHGRPDAARQALKTALGREPDHARALVLQSNMLIEERDLEGALEVAQRSAASDPAFPDAHLAVGVIQQERGEARFAVEAYRRYLDLAPDGLYAHSIRRQLRRLEAQVRGDALEQDG
jgi:hypothetical protein